MKAVARSLLRRLGVDLVRYAPRNFPHLRRAGLLADERIGLVLDVGAADGSWAGTLRTNGYTGRIISFEPLAQAFGRLEAAAAEDDLWEVHRVAVGAHDGHGVLHVAGNEQSSSLLPMTQRHLRHAPESAVAGRESVRLVMLDTVEFARDAPIFLKLDVQGSELDVLHGAKKTLRSTRLVEAELSAVELYEGQALLEEVIAYLRSAEFDLVGFETSFRDRSAGDLLQGNGFFRRRRA